MGTSGVVFAALPAFASDPRGARARVLPRRARPVARDGRDALGRRLAAVAARRLAPGRRPSPTSSPRPRRGAPGVEGCSSRRTSRASARRTPIPRARAAFTGLELRHDRGALVRAVLEGVAFGLRDSLELVRALGGPADRARASGGGARGLWLQIVASVLDLPIELTAVEEGSAYGAALLGGVAGGMFADVPDAVARCVRVRDDHRARPGLADRLRRRPMRASARCIPALDTVKEQTT